VARHKACGDALTPRALRELTLLDVDVAAIGGHRLAGVRLVHGDREVTAPWPRHGSLPDHATALRRDVLDAHLRQRAIDAGATVLMGHQATAPIVERGFVRGATLAIDPELDADSARHEVVRARFVVVADGANSSFGRELGTTRQRNWPYGIATRTYFHSDRAAESWIESDLGILDASGHPVAGYGWVIPLGDGTVNAGVGVLSTYRDIRGVNALKLLDSFAHRIADRWHLDPSAALKAPTRFRVPLAGSVGPKMGPTFLVAGDAAGVASPFNGDGVDAALMSGRLAAEVLDDALSAGNSTTLQRYPTMLADELGRYHQVGRLTARFLGRPTILRPALRLGVRSDRIAGAVLRIATNELRDGRPGGAERAYALASTISKFAPSW
jgi:geranylgeranyl reductase family protein